MPEKKKRYRWSRQKASRHQGLRYHHFTLHYTSTPPTATHAAASLPPASVKRLILTPSIGPSQQRAVVFVQQGAGERGIEGRMEGGREGSTGGGRWRMGEKSTDFAALFCVWETAGKKKEKRLNKIFNWSKPTKQCCQPLCGQMPQSFLPWERLRSLMKLEAWWLIVERTSQVLQKTVRIFRLPHPPTEMFPFSFLKKPPRYLVTPCSCLKWDENEAVWEGGVKSWLEVLPRP